MPAPADRPDQQRFVLLEEIDERGPLLQAEYGRLRRLGVGLQ